MLGLYIHVPFCQKRCHYCSFYSTTLGKKERDAYCAALTREMETRSRDYSTDGTLPHLSTIYFGGGTPSQLDTDELSCIFSAINRYFAIDEDAEVTFEVNPDDVTAEKIAFLKQLGVNRISMGVQSFNDETLRIINRRHTAQQALEAVETLKTTGIDNISIDLIYGLPGQTRTSWKSDLETAFSLPITHLSSYALSIEEGTHLYNMRARGEISDVDDETYLTMYEMLLDAASAAGFEHYEISNFSRPGYASRHNSSYWAGIPYLGLGPGAHSYDGKSQRRWNHSDLYSYLRYWESSATGNAEKCFSEEHLSEEECYDELVMTRLRTANGLSLKLLSPAQQEYLLKMAQSHLNSGLLRMESGKITLTRAGLFVSDDIMSDLMWET